VTTAEFFRHHSERLVSLAVAFLHNTVHLDSGDRLGIGFSSMKTCWRDGLLFAAMVQRSLLASWSMAANVTVYASHPHTSDSRTPRGRPD
jgi:hypothetical protein